MSYCRSLFAVLVMIGFCIVTVRSEAAQGPAQVDVIRIVSQNVKGPYATEDEKITSEITNSTVQEILQSLADVYGLTITAPRSEMDRKTAVNLKKVPYRDIIRFIFQDTEFEPVFEYPNVRFIRKSA